MTKTFKWESDTSTKKGYTFIGDTYKQMRAFCKNCNYELRIVPGGFKEWLRDKRFKGNRFNIKLKKGKVSKVWIG